MQSNSKYACRCLRSSINKEPISLIPDYILCIVHSRLHPLLRCRLLFAQVSKQFPVFIALGNVIKQQKAIEVALRLEMLDYYGMRRTGRINQNRCRLLFAQVSKQFPVFIALGNVIKQQKAIEVALRLEMLDYYGMRRTGRMLYAKNLQCHMIDAWQISRQAQVTQK